MVNHPPIFFQTCFVALKSLTREGTSSVTADEVEDKKRSGVFIIYTARHHFNEQQHNIDMTCVKLGNRK